MYTIKVTICGLPAYTTPLSYNSLEMIKIKKPADAGF